MIKTYYKNRLPHIAPIGAVFFITFRLGDSLPQHIVRKMRDEMKQSIKKLKKEKPDNYKYLIELQRERFFKNYDHQLDIFPHGKCYLKLDTIAQIVKERLFHLDNEKYDLLAFCIMPNHVHMLIDSSIQIVDENNLYLPDIPEDYMQLDQIMKRIKGASARYANLCLGRSGKFWQKDSYDHYVRNQKELWKIVNYILQNPVKARLAKCWEDYTHNYLSEKLLL